MAELSLQELVIKARAGTLTEADLSIGNVEILQGFFEDDEFIIDQTPPFEQIADSINTRALFGVFPTGNTADVDY